MQSVDQAKSTESILINPEDEKRGFYCPNGCTRKKN